MVQLLISIVVFLIVVAVVFYIVGLIPIPQPWLNIVRAIIGLIVLLVLLQYLGVWGGGASWHLPR